MVNRSLTMSSRKPRPADGAGTLVGRPLIFLIRLVPESFALSAVSGQASPAGVFGGPSRREMEMGPSPCPLAGAMASLPIVGMT